MATATKKPASPGKSSSAKKTTAKSGSRSRTQNTSTKRQPNVVDPAVKEAEDIHEKRAAYDNPPVDAPVAISDAKNQVEPIDGPCVDIVAEGSTVTLIVGKEKVVLDREGVHGFQRHFNKAAAGL